MGVHGKVKVGKLLHSIGASAAVYFICVKLMRFLPLVSERGWLLDDQRSK
jgi:hypothetical protein